MRFRLGVLTLLLCAAGGAVVVRAYDVQIRRAEGLRAMAEDQSLRDVRLTPRRGTILDRNGAELASSVDVDSVWVNPRQFRRNVEDAASATGRLAALLGLDRKVLRARLDSDRYFVWLKRRVSPKEAQAVRSLGLPGVDIAPESRRFYPNRELAAHVLGTANVDGGGIDGVELALDERLRGSAARVPALRDRRGVVVFSGNLDDRAARGGDVTLTIDRTIQHLAERELELAVRTFEARGGSVVVVDPRTGEILAIANYPTFNPNDPSRAATADRRNRALTDRFEPGSTMKPFTVAGALDRGVIREDQRLHCENGRMKASVHHIHDTHRYEMLSVSEIVQHSSNIGTAKIGMMLGRAGLYDALRGFGFGQRTLVSLPGETGGSLRDPSKWYEIDNATIAFGQGVSVTVLQLTMAMAALANEGRLMRPLLVKQVTDARGAVIEAPAPEIVRQAVSSRVAKLVTDMMVTVTNEEGTGIEAAVDGYLVAGKTGTAQKPDPVHGGYAEDRWSSSFVGFAPADAPRLAISVIIDEPLIAHYGGQVAAPAFRRIMEGSLRHLGVAARTAPVAVVEKDAARRESPLAEPRAERLGRVGRELAAGAAEQVASDARAGDASALASSAEGASEPPPGEGRVPDLAGLSARAVLVAARAAGFEVRLEGSGVVHSQRPAAHTIAAPFTRVHVTLGRPKPPRAQPTAATPVAPPTGARAARVAAFPGRDG
jgi:cell division protein FtsI (penicillin-binding protein 3)